MLCWRKAWASDPLGIRGYSIMYEEKFQLSLTDLDIKSWHWWTAITYLVDLDETLTEAERTCLHWNWFTYDFKYVTGTCPPPPDCKKILEEINNFQNYKAIVEFNRIKSIYETYFNTDNDIDIYEFISWAIDRDSIQVPDILINWKKRRDILLGVKCNFLEPLPHISLLANKTKKMSFNNKEKMSYLKLISALCNKNGKIDISSREATGKIRAALQTAGFNLDDKTIKKIKDEIQEVEPD